MTTPPAYLITRCDLLEPLPYTVSDLGEGVGYNTGGDICEDCEGLDRLYY